MSRIINLALFLFYCGTGFSQAVANQAQAPSSASIQLVYENDLFAQTDYYYTQGVSLLFTHPQLKRNPLNFLLWKPRRHSLSYGLALEQDTYTPTSILSDSILFNDRPFAATLLLTSSLLTRDTINRQSISLSLVAGIMGPAAGGYETQHFIHRQTGNILPHGWQHQVANDLVLNYNIVYEKELISAQNHFSLNGIASLRLGNLSTKALGGLKMEAGWFSDAFSGRQRKFRLSFVLHSAVNAIGYDATLQGGLLSRSDYTLPASAISRFVYTQDMGLVLGYRGLSLNYCMHFTTKEFQQGADHQYGSLGLLYSF